jgi:hypothetical protein
MVVNVEHLVELEVAGETEVLGDNLPQCHKLSLHSYFHPFSITDHDGAIYGELL